MKQKLLRCAVLSLIIAMLCAGAFFQYMTAEKNQRADAVLVGLFLHESGGLS